MKRIIASRHRLEVLLQLYGLTTHSDTVHIYNCLCRRQAYNPPNGKCLPSLTDVSYTLRKPHLKKDMIQRSGNTMKEISFQGWIIRTVDESRGCSIATIVHINFGYGKCEGKNKMEGSSLTIRQSTFIRYNTCWCKSQRNTLPIHR